jgi:hypothetical protein
MRARTIKTYTAIAAAAAAVSFGAAAAVATSVGSAAAPASATAHASRPVAASAATQSAAIMSAPRDDPHGSFDAGDQRAVLCATAIEYGLIM